MDVQSAGKAAPSVAQRGLGSCLRDSQI